MKEILSTNDIALLQNVSGSRIRQIWRHYRITKTVPILAKPGRPSRSITKEEISAVIGIHKEYPCSAVVLETILDKVHNLNAIEPVIRKAILSNINNALFLAKGSECSVNSSIPVSVSAKIINQLGNNRVDTTQGIDMTKKLVATEVLNAINSITTKSNTASHIVQQSAKIVVGNQAICSGIASPTKLACSFTINIHG